MVVSSVVGFWAATSCAGWHDFDVPLGQVGRELPPLPEQTETTYDEKITEPRGVAEISLHSRHFLLETRSCQVPWSKVAVKHLASS